MWTVEETRCAPYLTRRVSERFGLELQWLALPELKGERLVVHLRNRRDARFVRWFAQIKERGHVVPDVRTAVQRLRKRVSRSARGVTAPIAYAFALLTACDADRLARRLGRCPVCGLFFFDAREGQGRRGTTCSREHGKLLERWQRTTNRYGKRAWSTPEWRTGKIRQLQRGVLYGRPPT